MNFFHKNHLIEIVGDEDIFPVFSLSDREKHILIMHLLRGFTFRRVGAVLHMSHQWANEIFHEAIDEMWLQNLEILRLHKKNLENKSTPKS